MLVDTDLIVSSSKFRAHLPKYINVARQSQSAICVTQNGEVAGVFMSLEEYEHLTDYAVRDLLEARKNEGTVSHKTAFRQARARVATAKGKKQGPQR